MDTFGGFGSYRDHAFMDSPRHSSECAHEEHNGTAVAQESASLIRANFLDSMKQLQAKMTAENEDAKKRNRERKKARARERRDTLLMNTYLQELFPTAFGVLKESAPDPILEKKQFDSIVRLAKKHYLQNIYGGSLILLVSAGVFFETAFGFFFPGVLGWASFVLMTLSLGAFAGSVALIVQDWIILYCGHISEPETKKHTPAT